MRGKQCRIDQFAHRRNRMKTVIGLYDHFEDAQQALNDLHDADFRSEDISLVARDSSGEYSRYFEDQRRQQMKEDVGGGAAAGAGIGAVLGGLGGLLVGLGALMIPGIGPIIAAGPIATALAGAGVGAVAGGVVGALVDLGIPEEHAKLYAEGIRRGGTLVVVRTQDNLAEQARMLLNRFSPVDIENRAEDWRQNQWTGFNTSGQPLNADEMEFNRSGAAMPVTGRDVNRDINTPRTMSDLDQNRLGTRDMTDDQTGTGSG